MTCLNYPLQEKNYLLSYFSYIDSLHYWTNLQDNFINNCAEYLNNAVITLCVAIIYCISTVLIIAPEIHIMWMNNLETNNKSILDQVRIMEHKQKEEDINKIADFRLKIYRENWRKHIIKADPLNTKQMEDGKLIDKEFILYSIEIDDKNSNVTKKEKINLLEWIVQASFTDTFKLSSSYSVPKLKNSSERKITIEADEHGYYAKLFCPTTMMLTPGFDLRSKQKSLSSLSDLNFDVEKGLILVKIYYADPI